MVFTRTSNFSVGAPGTPGPGTHTIEFLGTNPQGGSNTALIDLVTLTAAQDEIIDGSFATPVLAGGSYQDAPSGSPWQFSGLAGIATHGSGIAAGNPSAPQGNQVGFIMNTGSISYSLDLDADTYNLSFLAAQRATNQAEKQQIEVLLDPGQADQQVIGSIRPSGTGYSLYETLNFTVAAGVHTLQLLGMSSPNGKSTALIDEVSLATADDPFTDGSFEVPALAAKSYAVTPSGCAWQFTGDAGLSTNKSASPPSPRAP